MKDMGVLDYIPTHEGLLRLDGFKEEVPLMPFMEPTWMDDTCVTFAASPPLDLERAAGRIGSSLLRLCDEFAMSPNLAKGKTGLMFVFQGRGANKVKTYQRLYAIQTLLMKASQKAALKARYGTVAWMDECGRMCMCICLCMCLCVRMCMCICLCICMCVCRDGILQAIPHGILKI